MNRNKGFTLIELLVVIAIIGILSSIVLASLSQARGKASNAAVKSQLASARASAELYYSDNNNYGTDGATGVCGAASEARRLLCQSGVNAGVNTLASCTTRPAAAAGPLYCYAQATAANGTTYVMATPLKVTEAGLVTWCVDSSGNSKGITTAVSGLGAALIACP